MLLRVGLRRTFVWCWSFKEAGYSAVSSLCGGLGVFFLIEFSFKDPVLGGGCALILLVAATGLVMAGEEASE
jgi:hypothetical protein